MQRNENEANVRCCETAVVKKEDSRLAENGERAENGNGLGSSSSSCRFLKQQIIFPIYEDASRAAR